MDICAQNFTDTLQSPSHKVRDQLSLAYNCDVPWPQGERREHDLRRNGLFGHILKYGYPQIIQFNGISLINIYKPSILGYPQFRKPPLYAFDGI